MSSTPGPGGAGGAWIDEGDLGDEPYEAFDDGAPGGGRRRRARRRRWPWILLLAVVLVVAWAVLATMRLLSAAASVRDAHDDVAALADLSPADLLDTATLDRLVRIEADLSAAADRTGSPLLAPAKVLPFLGRQLSSADALATAGAEGMGAATDALQEVQTLLDGPLQTGPQRVELLRRLQELSSDALATVEAADLGPSDGLLGPLRDARSDVATELDRVGDVLGRAVDATGGLADVLEGPHRYLLVAANNAEMRSATGFFGSLGVLTTDQGTFGVSQVVASSLTTPPEGSVTPTGDLADRWGWLQPAGDFRNLGLSPDFPSTAQLAVEMWAAAEGGEPLDGVIAVDPDFLEGVLDVTGPLSVGDRTFDARSVVAFLLNEQYRDITDYEAGSDYAARKDYLSQVTAVALAAINGGDLDPATLVESLRQAAQGRHVLAWSSHPAQQAAFTAATIDGALHDDSLVVSVVNRSATKLDWYLDVDAELTTRATTDGTEVTVDVQLRNEAPERESPYVIGPNPFLDPPLVEAEYFGVLALTIPGAASEVRLEGTDLLSTSGPDGPTQVAMGLVDVQRRETKHYVLRFLLPPEVTSLRVEPDARVPRTDYTLDGQARSDGEGHRVTFAGS